jgi:hypothetical protein
MQLAHWIGRTEIPALVNVIPPWMGMWFAVFPTVETLVAQLIAAILVVGSYYAARHFGHGSVEAGVPPASGDHAADTAAATAAKAVMAEQLEAVR